MSRLQQLLNAELDRELTEAEREELERLIVAAANAEPARPKLDTAKMAKRVVLGASARAATPRGVPRARAFVAGLAAIAAVATIAVWAASSRAVQPIDVLDSARAALPKPVEVYIGDASNKDERELAPVSIRF